MVKKSKQNLKAKLIKAEFERKSVIAALDNVEKQAEGQRVLLRNVEDQLDASEEQIIALKKRLEEV